MSRLKEIHEYFIKEGISLDKILKDEKDTVLLSEEIAKYALKYRVGYNGERRISHNFRCLRRFESFIGVCLEEELLAKYHIPFKGVSELCFLKDVLFLSDFKMDEIEEIFDECNFHDYFISYIKEPLLNITLDRNMDFKEYIKKCADNSISALVKLIDLEDQMSILSLEKLNYEIHDILHVYLVSMCYINSVYEFVENKVKYQEELEEYVKKYNSEE